MGLPGAGEEIFPAGQIAVIGVPVGVMGADAPLGLFRVDPVGQGGDDYFDDLVLDLEDVLESDPISLDTELA